MGIAVGAGAAAGYRGLYRLIMTLALPVLAVWTVVSQLRGRLPAGALAERLGLAPAVPSGSGPTLWLHGASNGELTSARWIIARLLDDRPGLRVLVTCNTATARAMVQGWGMVQVTAALAPFDAGFAASRVLARWRPKALIIVENELWPGRISRADRLGIPVLVVGARISERSAGRWQRVAPRLIARVLGQLAFVSAQDAGSEDRLVALGLPAGRIGPRFALKGQGLGAKDDSAAPPFAAPAPRAQCLLAASTHPGEDAPILDAFVAARAAGRFRHLILAPRHPRRAAEIAALITARGLSCAQRSQGEIPGPDTAVHLADTMGEMDHWFAMAGATVMGGTFAPVGGHTPWEPVAHGSALVHGPSVFNNADAYAALDGAGGALAIADAGDLPGALLQLDEGAQNRLAQAAQAALRPEGDADGLIAAVISAAGF